ncbi:hypothetical protein F7725_015946 [Dissostichus mawsoni]|uniref:GRAM domain-containing protein n=1 Tax=Dissostichus mawsoni TaxID=36200 RepID=A0A7J5Y6E1_DISMA|nr:hypothetical protein F7725_015946 [Dissostichus mawsoni]
MRKHLERIRFRGQRRDEFPDLADSPNTSDTESNEEVVSRPRVSARDSEELREAEGEQSDAQASHASFSAALHDDSRTDLNEVKDLKTHLHRRLKPRPLQHLQSAVQISVTDIFLQDKVWYKPQCIHVVKCQQPCNPHLFFFSSLDKQKDTWSSSFRKCLYDRFGVYIEDFRFQQEEQTVETDEPLSAKRLTENMRRLKRGLKPLSNFKRNLTALSSWYSVYTSAIAFIVYMYAAWHGWAVPMFLFLAIVRLSLNYLIARGWRIQWSIVPEVSEPVEPPKEDLTVSEKFTLVLDVAQKAQPELTQKLYVGLWLAFISSCLLPFKLLGFFIGVYAGIKFFVIDFLFKSCPKLRQRFDTPFIIWTHLPTDLQLKERGGSTLTRRLSESEQVTLSSGRGSVGPAAPLGASRDEDGGRYSSTKRGAFHEVFNLQESERPLTVCESGWRCCLINRDRKSPTDYIRNGYLYYKVLSVLPGSGSGISIATPSTTKPMVFGAMIHRDEAFDAIFNQHTKIVSAATAIEPET